MNYNLLVLFIIIIFIFYTINKRLIVLKENYLTYYLPFYNVDSSLLHKFYEEHNYSKNFFKKKNNFEVIKFGSSKYSYEFNVLFSKIIVDKTMSYSVSSIKYNNELNLITEKSFDILTANNEVAAPSIYKWITYYNGYGKDEAFSYPNVVVKCLGRVSPLEKLKLDYNLYIDDSPGIAELMKNLPDKKLLLPNTPWNKHIKNSFNVSRFESWKEVPGLIKSLTTENSLLNS